MIYKIKVKFSYVFGGVNWHKWASVAVRWRMGDSTFTSSVVEAHSSSSNKASSKQL